MAEKTEMITFRVSTQERQLLQEAARKWQVTQSGFLREAIRQAAGVGVKALADASRPQAEK